MLCTGWWLLMCVVYRMVPVDVCVVYRMVAVDVCCVQDGGCR